MGSVNDAWYLK